MRDACPDLAALDGPPAAVRDHVAACASCRLVQELLDERRRAEATRDRRAECAKFEMLIAARDDGTLGGSAADLLDAHLRGCPGCAAAAGTLAPHDDEGTARTLPSVSTSSYELGPEVARGGMGRVLRATDLRIGRPVALKELLGKSPTLAARFEREARVTAQLQHPAIVPIYEMGKWPDGTPFYAMRMVEGITLRDAMKTADALADRLALLPRVIAATEALAFAHAQGIIHRDVTPTNILVGEFGETVVIDWGLAKDLGDAAGDDEVGAGPYRDEAPAAELTRAGSIIGTAAYMPPEQARGEPVDARADVYALGAILYHLLAGEAPYKSRVREEALTQVLAGPPLAIAEVAPNAPRDLVSIVEKAMARDRTDRYADARELATELQRFQAGQLVGAHHYSTGERWRRWLRRHRAAAIATAAALVAVAAIATVAVVRIVDERDRAESNEATAQQQRAAAEQVNAELLEDQGQQALAQGDPVRAAVWLSASYSAGNTRPSLRMLLGQAMRNLESLERKLDCGSGMKAIEISPDRTAVLGVCERAIRLWRISDGVLLRTYEGPGNYRGAQWSRDGKLLIAKTTDGIARVWRAATGEHAYDLTGHTARLTNAQFSPDGTRILTSAFDRTIRLWDAATGAHVRTIIAAEPPQVGVRAALVDDARIVAASTDGVLKVWDAASGALLRTIDAGGQIVGGDFGKGKHIVACGLEGAAKIWDLDTGKLVHAFVGHSDTVWACNLSDDGRLLATGSNDGTAKVWDVPSRKLVQTISHVSGVKAATFAEHGRTLVTTEQSGGIRIWDVTSGALLGSDEQVGASHEIEPVIAGDRVFAARDTAVHVWRGLAGARARAFHAGADEEILALSDDAMYAIVGRRDEAVSLWSIATGERVPHEPLRLPIAERSGRVYAQTAGDVVVFDVRTGRSLGRLPIEKASWLEPGPDGRFLLVRRDGAPSEVWDVAKKEVVARWDARDLPVGLDSGNDRVLVWKNRAGRDPHAELWEVAPQRLVRRLDDLGDGERAWFSRDGSRVVVVSKSHPHVANIIDTATGRSVRALAGCNGLGTDATGTYLATARGAKVAVVQTSDGATIAEFPWGYILGGMGITTDGAFIGGGEVLKSQAHVIDRSGRVRAAVPFRITGIYNEDSYQVAGRQVMFTPDGARFISLGQRQAVSADIRPELRTSQEVARIVAERVPMRVERGQLVFVPGPRARAIGRVTRRGAAVERAEVRTFVPNMGPLETVFTRADGTFELPDLPIGKVMFTAQSLRVGAYAAPRDVELREGEQRLDIELDLAGSISGIIVDGRGAPLGNVQVRAVCAACGGDEGQDVTADDGRFAIRALSGGGDYALTAERTHKLEVVSGDTVRVIDGKHEVTGVRIVVKP